MEVAFQVFHQKIGDQRFKFVLNKKLVDTQLREGFNYSWIISLQIFQKDEYQLPTQNEEQILMSIFQKLIAEIIDDTEIRIIGVASAEVFEIFFYGKESDRSKIGGHIIEMKEQLEDQKDRFIKYSGKRDEDWANISRLYDYFFNL